ncbi:MAG: glycosyltransferase family 39 protein [Candidatus Lernaella stagnicola]|nr:glycosyltransferase family 39 protein [Candidatus Lernaella stagnicola]
MNVTYPRYWHRGRGLLLVTWLTATTSYLSLFWGATYVGDGFLPHHLLLGLLATQAVLLAAALLTHRTGFFSLADYASREPVRLLRFSIIAQGVLLVVSALAMSRWNDENFNLAQAVYLGEHGLRAWLRDYGTVNRWLGLHHPPLLPLLYGAFYNLVGPHVLAGRLFNIVFSLLSLLVAARLIERVTDKPTAALASLMWLCFPLWYFNGAAAILEGPFLLVFLLTADAFVRFLQEPKTGRALVAGALLTLGLLCRYNIALLIPGMVLILLLPAYRHLWRKPATWWIAGVPLLCIAPLAGVAAGSGLLATQAARLTWMALLARPGGVHYLLETMLPLWPLHVGAHVLPLMLLGLFALYKAGRQTTTLLALGGAYLFLVVLILPNPRYLLPAVPFIAAGAAIALQYLRERNEADTAVWAGLVGAGMVLTVLTVVGAELSGYYPFY